MGKFKKWLLRRDEPNWVVVLIFISLFIIVNIGARYHVNKYNDLVNEANGYCSEIYYFEHSSNPSITHIYNHSSPALKAYIHDIMSCKGSDKWLSGDVRTFGYKSVDSLIGVKYNEVTNTYYGIWKVHYNKDYSYRDGETLKEDMYIFEYFK